MATSIFDLIGGETKIRELVSHFYARMDTMPETKGIRSMHPADLKSSEDKLFMFLCGWLGGPAYFEQKFGHPRLRARHLPFKIAKSERDQWMLCMVHAFEDAGIGEPLRSEILHALLGLADHMRNQQEE